MASRSLQMTDQVLAWLCQRLNCADRYQQSCLMQPSLIAFRLLIVGAHVLNVSRERTVVDRCNLFHR
jgi:hypothetical protein